MYQVFHGQNFKISEATAGDVQYVSGDDILHHVFEINVDNPWVMLVIVFAFIIVLRIVHYLLLRHSVSPKFSFINLFLRFKKLAIR